MGFLFNRKKKKRKGETKLEKIGDQIKVTPSQPNKKQFYKELESKSPDEFLKEISEQTLDLWHSILKFSLKKSQIGDTRKINKVDVFAECADVSMAVMRTIKAQLMAQASDLEMGFMKNTGKTPKFLESLNRCIHLATAEDLKRLGEEMDRKKRSKQSYVA